MSHSRVFDVCYKVIVIGESRVGKTSILKSLESNRFDENTISTVGVDFVSIFYCIENTIIKLQLWDTAGQERYHTLTRGHFRKTKAIVLVYDITSKESFEKLKYWIECINEMQLFSESIFMIGNKLDLNKEREVPYEHAKRFADKNLIKFYEASARNSNALYEIFKMLAIDIFTSNDMMKLNQNKRQTISENSNNSSSSSKAFVYDYNMTNEIFLRNTLPASTANSANVNKRKKRRNPFKPKRTLDTQQGKSTDTGQSRDDTGKERNKKKNLPLFNSIVYLPGSIIQQSLDKYRASRSDVRKSNVSDMTGSAGSTKFASLRNNLNIESCCKLS